MEKKQITAEPDRGDVNRLTKEETKKILTPFAFEIDKSLFGLPLAVPWKRAVAISVDFMLIALLAEAPGELLAFVVALTFFRLGSKKRLEKLGKPYGIRRRMLRYLGGVMLFVILVDFLSEVNFELSTPIADTSGGKPELIIDNSKQVKVITEHLPLLDEQKQKQEQEHAQASSSYYKGVQWLKGIIDDLGLSFGWAAFYFSVLTAVWNGQTPGKKLMKIRVVQLDGTPLSVWDSFGRYGGYGAGLATGLLGFLQIYWDPNRQAIHDKISATVVTDLTKQVHQ
nr:RDD family protein [Thalassotalea sp. G2M2-11]